MVGDNELAAGSYLLKDMTSGEQQALSKEALFARIKN
jgi:histidyl-tRNA synthetase